MEEKKDQIGSVKYVYSKCNKDWFLHSLYVHMGNFFFTVGYHIAVKLHTIFKPVSQRTV